jgi:hypothetical protein
VTGSTANARDNATSISVLQKAYRDTLQSGILLNVCLFIGTVGAVFLAIWVGIRDNNSLSSKLLTTIAWPPLLHLCFLAMYNNWVPIVHLFSPPVYHSRESRLVTTEKGKSYPNAEVDKDLNSEDSFLGLSCLFVVLVVLFGTLMGALTL